MEDPNDIAQVFMRDQCVRKQVKVWMREALTMDPVDAINDAETLVEVLKQSLKGRKLL